MAASVWISGDRSSAGQAGFYCFEVTYALSKALQHVTKLLELKAQVCILWLKNRLLLLFKRLI
jgi:hypothetical protein